MAASRIPGFHDLSREDRLAEIVRAAGLTNEEAAHLADAAGPEGALADDLSENVISVMSVPLGVATNMIVDGEDVLVPMATEESSVIAAVCNGAKACRVSGGVATSADAPRMIAQVQVKGLSDPEGARLALYERIEEIRAICDACDPMLVQLGGGFREIEARIANGFLILHLI
ncbi:MAG: 3-hydroxy-3-methylglutaryl-CoA reductase, partial [Pseudomonadota bacterium]